MSFDMVRSAAELRLCLGEKSLVLVTRRLGEMSRGCFIRVGRRIGKVVACSDASVSVQWVDKDGRLTPEKAVLHLSTYRVLYRNGD